MGIGATEAELFAVDAMIEKMLWTKKFIEWQRFEVL